MQSKASTVKEYLASLPADRRAATEAVRKVILKNLDKDFEEGMQYGMIGYYVPHRVFPAGYHCDPTKPLGYAALASQKGSISVYLTCVYGSDELRRWFVSEWKKSGKKLDMGKSCVRFKKVEDAALDVIGAAIKRVKARDFVESYVKIRAETEGRKAGHTNASAGKTGAKKAVAKRGAAVR